MKKFVIKVSKNNIHFETLSKFYCKIFEKLAEYNFVVITDFTNFFLISNSEKFCNLCFEPQYLNLINQYELLFGIKTKKINYSKIDALLNDYFLNSLNKFLNKANLNNDSIQIWNIEKSRLVDCFKLIQCPTCKNHKHFEDNINSDFLKQIQKPKQQNQKLLLKKLENEFQTNLKSLIIYFSTFKLNDLGYNHYFSTILSTLSQHRRKYSKILCSGQDQNRNISKLKAFMEFIERYSLTNQEYNSATSNKLANFKLKKVTSSSGVAAHIDPSLALQNSILENVERDAFINWWLYPENGVILKPSKKAQKIIESIKEILAQKVGNHAVEVRLILLKSLFDIPTVLAIATSTNNSLPPAILSGASADFKLAKAQEKSLYELYGSTLNFIVQFNQNPTWFKKTLNLNEIKNIKKTTDHGQFYMHQDLIEYLKFLPIILAQKQVHIKAKCKIKSINDLIKSLSETKWLALDITPAIFKKYDIFVVRSILPTLKEIRFGKKSIKFYAKEKTSNLSVAKYFPHFFS